MNNKPLKQRVIQFSALLLVLVFFQPVQAETNKSLQDCASCHEKQANEFEASIHYINRSGVQAGCNNCHAGLTHKQGSKTSKTVNKDRLEMAVSEWNRFSKNDSKECKSCHNVMFMDYAKQEPRSVARHEESFNADVTSCINCHKGISHYLPAGWKEKAMQLK